MHSLPDSSATFGAPRASSSASHFQSLGAYSAFLRSAMADEESLQLRDNLQVLAVQVEALVLVLQQPAVDAAAVASALLHLVEDLRGHRTLVLSLGGDWHQFYEFDAHFATLNQFRILVNRWAMQAAPPTQTVPSVAEFDVAAWRLLGAGAMLLDVYEQSRQPAPAAADPLPQAPARPSWWQRVRGWWQRPEPVPEDQHKPGRRGRRRSDG